MIVPDNIKKLVETFDYNLESYKKGAYNETQLRREFIDPFFEHLGWDVSNKKGYAEAYKDVIHEDSIKVGGVTKAPDYCFRIGGFRKFFLEAKKPSINIKDDIHPAYQLRRYGWSAKLPLSILTDFEEFAVYDCRVKPVKTDKASNSRIQYLKYTDYIDKWEELSNIFSREAILKGSFDKYAESNKSKKGTAKVDTAFLQEIERWREILARNIALKNSGINQKELNFAVQQTIDRIVFLRICEDRGIEQYGRLMALQGGANIYKRLFQLFNKADEKYNSGLFHFKKEKDRETFDNLTPYLNIDDKVLKDIFKNLYYPDSPYEFSVLPADILGQVYERFLGKIIKLTSKQRAVIEDKPEVRKAGGVYYTPTYIVDYIVSQTIGRLVEGKKPGPKGAVSKLKILDPACGSGSFLIGAYQFLLDWHLEQYIKDDPKKWEKGKVPRIYQKAESTWRLTTDERKRILINNIYGVDIDHQAVEVTKLSLLLKVLEGEDEQTMSRQLHWIEKRVLPDLSNNIKCGNSLIGSDFYDDPQPDLFNEDEMYRINAFDWDAEFAEVMGQGGFDAVIGNPPYGASLSKEERNYLENKFRVGNTDTAALFLIHSKNISKVKGFDGFIIPKSFTYASNWRKTRDALLYDLNNIVDCSKVWKEVKLEMSVYVSQKDIKNKNFLSFIRENEDIIEIGTIKKSTCNDFGFIINGISDKELKIGLKLHSLPKKLNDFVLNQRGGMFQKEISNVGDMKVLSGKQIKRYYLSNEIKGMVDFQKIQNDEKCFINKKSILVQNIVAHIMNPNPHIKIIATIPDNDKFVILDTINQLTNNTDYDLKYILGVLNSNLVSWYVYKFIFANAIRTMHFDSYATSRIPFVEPDKTKHKKMVELVYKILELHKKTPMTPQEKTIIDRQINTIDKKIDQLVYKLYGLTEEEIKIIENTQQ